MTKWKLGDLVKKKQGSEWRGVVVGFYQTDLTSTGYSVKSLFETNSVQVWPEAALEDWDGEDTPEKLKAKISELESLLKKIKYIAKDGAYASDHIACHNCYDINQIISEE